MLCYEASTTIAAQPEAVWLAWSDVTHWPEWLPTVTSVEPLGNHPLTIGSSYRVLQPRLCPATWVVTRLEPPRRFLWESRTPGLSVTADHIVDRSREGITIVFLRVSFSGFLGAAVGRLVRSTTRRYLAREAAALKAKVEANASS